MFPSTDMTRRSSRPIARSAHARHRRTVCRLDRWWKAWPLMGGRFRETDQVARDGIQPADLILRSRAKHGVSKDGGWHELGLWPSFETRARARSSGRG